MERETRAGRWHPHRFSALFPREHTRQFILLPGHGDLVSLHSFVDLMPLPPSQTNPSADLLDSPCEMSAILACLSCFCPVPHQGKLTLSSHLNPACLGRSVPLTQSSIIDLLQ